MVRLHAVSGKGGVGKTAVAAALLLALRDRFRRTALGVDADPNSTLAETLGLRYEVTLADLRESRHYPQGVPKPDVVELGVEQALVEGPGFDLLVMGRPEGPGCYCAINRLLRTTLHRVASRYEAVVVDNEAGMEHISRRTTDAVDTLLVVTAPTAVSLRSARRILSLAEERNLSVRRTVIVRNQWSPSVADDVAAAAAIDAEHTIELPYSPGVEAVYAAGGSFTELPPADPFLTAVREKLAPLLDAASHGDPQHGG